VIQSLCFRVLLLASFTFVWVVFSSVRISEIRFKLFRFVLLSCCSIFKDHSPARLLRVDLPIIPHRLRLVNTFFKTFFGFLKVFLSRLVRSGFLAPHASAVSLYILSYFPLFVNSFFHFSFIFLRFVKIRHLLQTNKEKNRQKDGKTETHEDSTLFEGRFLTFGEKSRIKQTLSPPYFFL